MLKLHDDSEKIKKQHLLGIIYSYLRRGRQSGGRPRAKQTTVLRDGDGDGSEKKRNQNTKSLSTQQYSRQIPRLKGSENVNSDMCDEFSAPHGPRQRTIDCGAVSVAII
jgi:hypothetical protein